MKIRHTCLALIFQMYSAALWACCSGEPHCLSELLLHDQRNRHVFQGQIVQTYATLQGAYYSKVRVLECFKGEIKTSTVWVYTGGNNSAGGYRASPGTVWLFFGEPFASGAYTATVCDLFSCTSNTAPENYATRLQILKAYQRMKQSNYTGPVIWYYRDSLKAAEGHFKDGQAEDKWKHFRYDGSLKSEMFYQNGLLHGETTEYLEPERGIAYSTYKNGVLLFQTTNYTNNKYRLRSTWENLGEKEGLRREHRKTWHPNGQLSSDQYEERNSPANHDWCMYNGHEGAFIQLDSNGNIINQGQYFKGAKVGKWIEQKKNSRDTLHINYPQPEMPDYDFVRFFENGQLQIMGNFKNGLPNGKWMYYNFKGFLRQEAHFIDGKLSGEVISYHYCSDKVAERHQYLNGLQHGAQFRYFENGSIQEQYSCKKGQKQGSEITYHKPGIWQTKANYLDGKLHGDYISTNHLGDTSLVAHFREGVLEGKATEYFKENKIGQKAIGMYLDRKSVV